MDTSSGIIPYVFLTDRKQCVVREAEWDRFSARGFQAHTGPLRRSLETTTTSPDRGRGGRETSSPESLVLMAVFHINRIIFSELTIILARCFFSTVAYIILNFWGFPLIGALSGGGGRICCLV